MSLRKEDLIQYTPEQIMSCGWSVEIRFRASGIGAFLTIPEDLSVSYDYWHQNEIKSDRDSFQSRYDLVIDLIRELAKNLLEHAYRRCPEAELVAGGGW